MKKIYFFFVFYSFIFCFGQSDFVRLEREVFALNRKGEFSKSQKKILNFLDRNDLSNREEAELNVLLANTYRSLNDYPTCIEYLLQAQSLTGYITPSDSVVAKVNAQLAFAYFDSNQYEKSGNIMKLIRKNNFLNQSQQDKAYLIMQEGYLHFLDKDFEQCNDKYKESFSVLNKVSPCDAPVILVKQMQLYGSTKEWDKVEETYKKSMANADSCGILKYKVYATEELKRIYEKNEVFDKAVYYAKVLDSLNNKYKRDDKVAMLHNESQKYVEEQKERIEKSGFVKMIIYVVSSILLIVLGYYFYMRSSYHKREKEKLDAELSQMKKELKAFSEYQFTHQNSAKEPDVQNFEKLNDRQKELLKYMTEGFSNKEIAEKLFITEATVKYHIKNIYDILELKNRRDFFAKISKKQ